MAARDAWRAKPNSVARQETGSIGKFDFTTLF